MSPTPAVHTKPIGRDDRDYEDPSRDKTNDPDVRTPGERDRDRILYTSAFRRLAGVTQVVGAIEGHVFHNRLTHTLEVAQIARRLAERFIRQERPERLEEFGGLDADVAEAAGLAHDLGHPPFGHIAEETLYSLAEKSAPDGFEGNAQSFRIVTRLTAHRDRPNYHGLNLTRATLNAVLKYPWLKADADPEKPKKFGAYTSEGDFFAYARAGRTPRRKSLEAAIMDHADNVAYSVHDVDDFYRAGLIPLQEVWAKPDEHVEMFKRSKKVRPDTIDKHYDAIVQLATVVPTQHRYSGTYDKRAEMRQATSTLIHMFVTNVSLGSAAGAEPALDVPEVITVQMKFLQHLVWRYVIENPRLATQQYGQKQIIETLFGTFHEAIKHGNKPLIPAAFHKQVAQLSDGPAEGLYARQTRIAVDIVASLTDNQATVLYRRLTGVAPGSVTDILDG